MSRSPQAAQQFCLPCDEDDLRNECVQIPNVERPTSFHNHVNRGRASDPHREHQRIELHTTLIEHASRCVNPRCVFSNCVRMKACIRHVRVCKVRAFRVRLSL